MSEQEGPGIPAAGTFAAVAGANGHETFTTQPYHHHRNTITETQTHHH
ncbi:hypothetical protein NX794_32950 [Streptomyces sp. LP11]|uniref:Uncharacterized protein n=1 Tax=Streptomyces pyxinicus TaxID=2970331 RepID=A0ABT2BBU2_9ACTN|nr:hypothetical protein [Streptomyces sp. LP11]MCS0605980.1 hypothetical protein [Streptomyces sp. LP11]